MADAVTPSAPKPQRFPLGDVELQSGVILPEAQITYVTYGHLNSARDNAILLLTYYTGTHHSYAPIIGPGRALDPEKYFIVIPNMFGNGESSSPSNTPSPFGGGYFPGITGPGITIYDNVHCQHRLLTEGLGIERLALVTGWSMGGIQAFHWAALYPAMVERLLPYCGSARISPHNWVFLEGVKAALMADPTWQGGHYTLPPSAGLKAFGRVYAGWAYSQTFFRDGLYRQLGYATPAELLAGWEADHLAWDANDLLAMLWTWQQADVSQHPAFQGNFSRAMEAITARAVVMPCVTDLYFPVADSSEEVRLMPNAQLRVIYSEWGHCAGGPGRNPEDTTFLENAMKTLLAQP
jgi:homoserine O-acetyltransferase